jgi:hypothetical protein
MGRPRRVIVGLVAVNANGEERQMMIPFLLGAGVGYVLGARAGRERYEQIARAYRRVADNPTVQGAAGVARAKAGEALQAGVSAARDRVAGGPGRSGPAGPGAPGRAAGPGTNGTRPYGQTTRVDN